MRFFSITTVIKEILWYILLVCVFIRPFVSEYAFVGIGLSYIRFFIVFSLIYIIFIIRKIRFLRYTLNLAVSIFFIVTFISVCIRGLSTYALYELYLFLPNFLIFYIISNTDGQKIRQLMEVIIFSGLLIGFYAIYQYNVGLKRTLDYIIQKGISFKSPHYIKEVLVGRRAFATFISPNMFAGYLIMLLFLSLGFLLYARQKRFVYTAVISILGLSLVYTKSIGAILSFMAVFIFWLYFVFRQLNFKKVFYKKILIGLVYGLFFLVLLYLFIVRHKISSFFDFTYAHNSIIQRLNYWQSAIKMIRDHPFLGVGFRQFGIFYQFYKLPKANVSQYVHNVFLQITTEQGLLGLFCFLAIVYIFFTIGIRILKENSPDRILKFSVFCAGLVFLINNLVDLSFYFGQIAFFWWLILGIVSSYTQKL